MFVAVVNVAAASWNKQVCKLFAFIVAVVVDVVVAACAFVWHDRLELWSNSIGDELSWR